MKMISKRAQGLAATTITDNVQTLKNELNRLTPILQGLPNQLDAVNQLVKNIEKQVVSLEQQRVMVQKQQQQMQQTTQVGQKADDMQQPPTANAPQPTRRRVQRRTQLPMWIQKLWAKMMPDQPYDYESEGNSVAGVRGATESDSKKVPKDKLPGGEADNVPEEELNKKQLGMGEEVELEHTDDREIAREIARDHLSEELKDGKEKEDQEYYTKLKKVHDDSCKDVAPAFWRRNLDYGDSNG